MHFNGAQAAIAAGYSSRRARQAAAELLARPRVEEAIAAKAAAAAARAGVTRERTIQELARMAFAPVGKRRGEIDVAMKLAALVLLGRFLGMFGRRPLPHGNGGGGPFTLRVPRRATALTFRDVAKLASTPTKQITRGRTHDEKITTKCARRR